MEIAVKLKPGQNINDLAKRYRLKLVKEIAYSPDTWIVEAEDDDLLAGLDAANALIEREKVEFATPQLLRFQARKSSPGSGRGRKN